MNCGRVNGSFDNGVRGTRQETRANGVLKGRGARKRDEGRTLRSGDARQRGNERDERREKGMRGEPFDQGTWHAPGGGR